MRRGGRGVKRSEAPVASWGGQELLVVALQREDARKMGGSQKSRFWALQFGVRVRLGYEQEWDSGGRVGSLEGREPGSEQ